MHDSSMRRSQTTDLYDLVQADHNISDVWKLPVAIYLARQARAWTGPGLSFWEAHATPCPYCLVTGRKDERTV